MTNTTNIRPEILDLFEEKGCTITNYVNTTHIEYKCACGKERIQSWNDFKRRACRNCVNQSRASHPTDEKVDEETGEIWKPVQGGYISNFGRAKNSLGQDMKLCPIKYRYYIGGKQQYASRLVSMAFQLPNFEKIQSQSYIVHHIDGNPANNRVDNLIIKDKSSSVSSRTYVRTENKTTTETDYNDIEYKRIPEFPHFKIYANGEIWNGSRFLNFTTVEGYLSMTAPDHKTYKVHRLICYAFHPLPDKTRLIDYDKIQVNHKNGCTTDNRSENLEWVSRSENIQHAYDTLLNSKRVKHVLQFNKDGKMLKYFNSMACARKETNEPEHRISAIASGKTNSKAMFGWKFAEIDQAKQCYIVREGDKVVEYPFKNCDRYINVVN